jgi:hypothetical protein
VRIELGEVGAVRIPAMVTGHSDFT